MSDYTYVDYMHTSFLHIIYLQDLVFANVYVYHSLATYKLLQYHKFDITSSVTVETQYTYNTQLSVVSMFILPHSESLCKEMVLKTEGNTKQSLDYIAVNKTRTYRFWNPVLT